MAYSRWNGSDWYIFWHSSDAKIPSDELLAIWYLGDEELPTYTYAELKSDREKAWSDISSRVKSSDRETFDKCIDWFLEGVEKQYTQENQS